MSVYKNISINALQVATGQNIWSKSADTDLLKTAYKPKLM